MANNNLRRAAFAPMTELPVLTIRCLAIVALAVFMTPLPAVAQQYDQMVTPDYFPGSGNDNAAFTLIQENGVELALRGKLRFDATCAPQNTFNSNHDGTYSFEAVDRMGCASWADGDTPEWSFEWSVNTDYAGSTGRKLGDLTFQLGMDADPTLAGTDFLAFDPINVPFADHAIGDNTTTDGFNEFTAADAAQYASLVGGYNVAQQSWNYEFFDNPTDFPGTPLAGFEADVPGFYDIYLKAFDGATPVASVEIQVVIGGGCFAAPNPVAVGGQYTVTTGSGDSEEIAPSEPGIYTPGDAGYDVPAACGKLVAYDPAGGFATGGGWILSPEGALTLTANPWNQDFSVDDSGWFDSDDEWSGEILVAGGEATVIGDSSGAPFSRFDGYRDVWPGTWIAEIDVYLDPAWPAGQGFDYSVAASGSDGNHQRDYIFHVGTVEDYGPIVGKALLVNGSNNADFTTNPFKLLNDNNGDYYEVPTAGWYTLQHVFHDAGGHLAVDLNLIDADGNVLWTATRSNVADTIPGEVGGNRYAWFTHIDVAGGVQVDNHQLFLEEVPSPESRANFGFVSKYKKGAQAPTGSTEFVFKAGHLDFHSDTQQWLVVTGSNYARFKGTGTINGEGEYKFMIWAGDGEPDTFRIKIWTEDAYGAETVVYDNGSDQAIGAGQIMIHTGKGGDQN